MGKMRVGLIGLGKVADVHLAGFTTSNAVEVVAGTDINPARLAKMSGKWGFKGYSDPGEMLARERPDIACVLTPPSTHRAMTELAAAHGVHVLCEKPMALNLDEGRAMVEAVRRAGVKFYYGSSYRCLPAVRKARELISQGVIGRVSLLMETYIGGAGPEGWVDLGDRHYPKGGPGGGGMGLVDHGIHLADIMPWLLGTRVRSVAGRGNLSGAAPAPEFLSMQMENGAMGLLVYHEATHPAVLPMEGVFSLGASWDVQGNIVPGGDWDRQPQCIWVYGETGALRIFHYANQLVLMGLGRMRQIPVDGRANPGHFGLQVDLLAEAIGRDAEPESTGLDGLRALSVVLAAYQSWEQQAIIPVEL